MNSKIKHSHAKKILMIMMSLILILMTGCSTKGLLNNNKDTSSKSAKTDKIYGKWVSDGGSYYVFNSDGTYTWYKSKDDTKDNYYKGKITFLKGNEGMKELGITDEEFSRLSSYTKDKNNVYSVKLHLDQLHSEGIDKSDKLDKSKYYWLSIIMVSNDKALVVNVDTTGTSTITRVTE